MSDARLQLAFAGLHPERTRRLLDLHGPSGAVAAVERGAAKTTARIRAEVAVPADVRRRELRDAGIEVVLHGGPGYPPHLAELPDAPDLLFVRGHLPMEPGVAIVGTRRCTTYGRRLARRYGQAVATAGWPLVSGLARGIDGAAHRGTVEAGGVGTAVLGCGIDVAYPPEHRDLGEDLIRLGGAVVSEAPPGTPPEGWRFPPRNRIIAGLSRAVVVVEAAVTGGALITARAALEQGISVFAVPGDVERRSSEGCNLLIRDGAHPVFGPEDLVEALSLVLGPPPGRPEVPESPDEPSPVTGADAELLDLVDDGIGSLDRLVELLGWDPPAVLAGVGRLEAGGALRRDGDTVVRAG
jgi:DNA processing protein